jgi:uncharacterized membrane protein
MTDSTRNRLLWGIIILFAFFNFLKPISLVRNLGILIPVLSILIPVFFVLIHGSRRMGWRTLAVFFVIAFVVSWCYESLSIATGFPFGYYHYTEKLGLKLGAVSLLIMPAYFAMCYLSWHLAHILLDKFDQHADRLQKFAIPVLATFIMVMWDLSMDPARSTIDQSWVWRDGGSYFGVPFSNFLGWFLCVYTIFQLFALYQAWSPTKMNVVASGDDQKNNWHQVTALYGATSLDFIAFAIFPPANQVLTDLHNQTWNSTDIYVSLGLVSIFTMLFVTILSFIKVQISKTLKG